MKIKKLVININLQPNGTLKAFQIPFFDEVSAALKEVLSGEEQSTKEKEAEE